MAKIFVEAKDRKELAKKINVNAYPIIKKVTGGYMCFNNAFEYDTWKKQK
jgi:hypothetical protein